MKITNSAGVPVNSALEKAMKKVLDYENEIGKQNNNEALNAIKKFKSELTINNVDNENDIDASTDKFFDDLNNIVKTSGTKNTAKVSENKENDIIKFGKIDIEKLIADGIFKELTLDDALKLPVEENKDKTLSELMAEGLITGLNKQNFLQAFRTLDKSIDEKLAEYEQIPDSWDKIEKLCDELFEKYKDMTLGEVLANYSVKGTYVRARTISTDKLVERILKSHDK